MDTSFIDQVIRIAKPGETTMADVIREYFPEATDEECDDILWEKTPFPFGPVRPALKELLDKHLETV